MTGGECGVLIRDEVVLLAVGLDVPQFSALAEKRPWIMHHDWASLVKHVVPGKALRPSTGDTGEGFFVHGTLTKFL
jgi:hypothetical protein